MASYVRFALTSGLGPRALSAMGAPSVAGVAAWLTHRVVEEGVRWDTAMVAMAGLRWHARRCGGDEAFESPDVRDVVQGLQRLAARREHGAGEQRAARVGLTAPQLANLSNYFARAGTVGARRVRLALELGFFGLMRASELFGAARIPALTWGRVQVRGAEGDGQPAHLLVRLPFSKADQNGRGEEITIAAESALSACDELRAALGEFPGELAADAPVFGPTARAQRFSQAVRAALRALGYVVAAGEFTPHCLRIGGAQLLQGAGVAVERIMESGRWASDSHWLYHAAAPERRLETAQAAARHARDAAAAEAAEIERARAAEWLETQREAEQTGMGQALEAARDVLDHALRAARQGSAAASEGPVAAWAAAMAAAERASAEVRRRRGGREAGPRRPSQGRALRGGASLGLYVSSRASGRLRGYGRGRT
jgi:hypothetical protein